MNTLFVGKNFVSLGMVDSTNTFANQLLEINPAEGTVVIAQHQTAGKGQQGSTWSAEPSLNLTFSLILYPRFLAPRQIFLLNKLIACALWDTLAAMLPEGGVEIKWPNDILARRRKIAGILIETSLDRDSIRSAIIGIGLNVNQMTFSGQLHGAATSMALQAGKTFDAQAVLSDLLERIEARYLAIRAGRHEGVERAYLERLYAYQEDTLIEIAGQRLTVHVVGIDPDGRLAVQRDGKLYFYGVKEIRFCLA
ncbi:MAG: hypothetical protein RLZZ165_284 [Bacteroidota bacterium]